MIHAIAEGILLNEILVGEVMTQGLALVPVRADLHEALETMRAGALRRLIVKGKDGRLAGILSLDANIRTLAADIFSLAGVIRSERERENAEDD